MRLPITIIILAEFVVWFLILPVPETPKLTIYYEVGTNTGILANAQYQDHKDGIIAWDRERVAESIKKLTISFGADVATALRIAECESSLNPTAKNPSSSALGLYQWTSGSWRYIQGDTRFGERTDPVASTIAFLTYYPTNPQWWEQCL